MLPVLLHSFSFPRFFSSSSLNPLSCYPFSFSSSLPLPYTLPSGKKNCPLANKILPSPFFQWRPPQNISNGLSKAKPPQKLSATTHNALLVLSRNFLCFFCFFSLKLSAPLLSFLLVKAPLKISPGSTPKSLTQLPLSSTSLSRCRLPSSSLHPHGVHVIFLNPVLGKKKSQLLTHNERLWTSFS